MANLRKHIGERTLRACAEPLLNVWAIHCGGQNFLVSTSHLLIDKHKSGYTWSRQAKKMSAELKAVQWYMPKAAIESSRNVSIDQDVVFAKAPPMTPFLNLQTFLPLSTASTIHATDGSAYYREYSKEHGHVVNWMGAEDVMVWSDPRVDGLLLSSNVGFKGMSGALCISRYSAEVLGIYVCREKPRVDEWSDSEAERLTKLTKAKESPSAIRPAQIPAPQPHAAPSAIHPIDPIFAAVRDMFTGSARQDLAEERHLATMDYIAQVERNMEKGFERALTKADLDEVVNVSHKRVAHLIAAPRLQELLLGDAVAISPSEVSNGKLLACVAVFYVLLNSTFCSLRLFCISLCRYRR